MQRLVIAAVDADNLSIESVGPPLVAGAVALDCRGQKLLFARRQA
jgi:hypothetical protein